MEEDKSATKRRRTRRGGGSSSPKKKQVMMQQKEDGGDDELAALAALAADQVLANSAESVSEEWDDARIWDELEPSLAKRLRSSGVSGFWAVQRRVLPVSLRSERDLCVSAPTGSGKTLVYALTVLHRLAGRRVPRLRALVVVPSRELARQVYLAMQVLVQEGALRVSLAVGQALQQEEPLFLDDESSDSDEKTPRGGRLGAPDALVCTPGRLVEHIDETPGFTLQHLRYLVVDEADRLLQQNYHAWIDKLMDAAYSTECGHVDLIGSAPRIEPTTRRVWPGSGEGLVFFGEGLVLEEDANNKTPLQKMLFSATLGEETRYASLRLRQPLRFQVGVGAGSSGCGYALPETLTEQTAMCSAQTKPLCLLSLLGKQPQDKSGAIVFASSVDTTKRLAALLRLWYQSSTETAVHEISSQTSRHQKGLDLSTTACCVIVATDGLARGIDLAHVDLVVNYDAPTNLSAYVHRVGRTARAGRDGLALTLLKRGQERAFARLRQEIDDRPLERLQLEGASLEILVPKYKDCLGKLKRAINDHGGSMGSLPRFKNAPQQKEGRKSEEPVNNHDDDDEDDDDEESDDNQSDDNNGGGEVSDEEQADGDDDDDDAASSDDDDEDMT